MARVLVVDDHDAAVYMMSTLLRAHGYEVDTAAHGAEALVKAHKTPPDVIISDLLMPVMDGFTLCRRWKADERLSRIPFMVCTATYTAQQDMDLAIQLGADAFIAKPAEPEAILAQVRKTLAEAGKMQARQPSAQEKVLLREYNEVLIRKLEEKLVQLEETNLRCAGTEAHLRLALTAAGMETWDWDLGTGRVVWSPAHARLFGLKEGEFDGRLETLLNAVHPDDRAELLLRIEAAKANHAPYLHEYRVIWRDGSEHWIAGHGRFEYDASGAPLRMRGVVADVSERKRAEDRIRELNRDLELRVRERTAQLEEANKELESFSYSISHDLQAPLRAIEGFSQLLIEEHAPHWVGEAQDYLERIQVNTRKMNRLIDGLLTLARVGRSAIRREQVLPAALVREVLEDLETARAGRQVEILVEEMPVQSADPGYLRQVFFNLLSNALKFTRSQEKARIQVGCREEDGRTAFFVRDNGIGFDMRNANRLFTPFQRMHRSEEYEGSGVGLAIVQRIVRRHGGRIWVETQPDQGATFCFTLEAGSSPDQVQTP
jgi:PAS domain S-box-containing protein